MDGMADELEYQPNFKGFPGLPQQLPGDFEGHGMALSGDMAGPACLMHTQLTRQEAAVRSSQLPFHMPCQSSSAYAIQGLHDRFPRQFLRPANTDFRGFAYEMHQP